MEFKNNVSLFNIKAEYITLLLQTFLSIVVDIAVPVKLQVQILFYILVLN